MNHETVLVTGGAGFVGTNLIELILKNAIIVDPSQKINSKGSIVIKDKIIFDLILNKDISFDKNNYHIIDWRRYALV